MKPMYRLCLLIGIVGCSQPTNAPVKVIPNQAPPPSWVFETGLSESELCGIGIAGPGYPQSPYPKELSKQRSIQNLAGALATRISEAMIDHTRFNSTSLETAHSLVVDESLLTRVSQQAQTQYWLDSAGAGPFMQTGFTYAHSCIQTPTAVAAVLRANSTNETTSIDPRKAPPWLRRSGRQGKERLCAVGFSGPTFYPDQTFSEVIKSIRLQLKKDIQTLVSSYQEDKTNHYGVLIEAITVASTEAISKGAVVSHYWYDKDGIGPYEQKESTYGWGCVYPLDILTKAVETVKESLPKKEKKIIEQVRKRANQAFDALENEIDTQANKDSPQASKL